ncbi:MAG: hypothetical protein ACRD2W_06010, partial [Acidimicrobiales bacterium]
GAGAAATAPFPTREELTLAWGDHVITTLPQRVRARFRFGRFTGTDRETALFALPDKFHLDRCSEVQPDVEEALSAHFGRRIRLRLVVDGAGQAGSAAPSAEAGPPPEPPPPDDEPVSWDELTDAPPGAVPSPLEHVMQAFQGAEVVEEDQ